MQAAEAEREVAIKLNEKGDTKMRVKSKVKAGAGYMNHSQTVKGLRVKSSVKAGTGWVNHNQAVKGLRVKSRVKAGMGYLNHNQTITR
jgi:hypothetical protein